MSKSQLTLYHLEDCPACKLVRKKLSLLLVPVLLVPVKPNKDDRTELIKLSGQKSVPVLQDGNIIISNSLEIISYLDKTFGNATNKPMPSGKYGIDKEVNGTILDVREKVITAFKEQGFGLLTEIDVKKTLKEKIDVDVVSNYILGFCNPKFAHQAMQIEPDIALLLPCNVVVREKSEGVCFVSAIKPTQMFGVVSRDDMLEFVENVQKLIENAIENIN